MARSLRIEYEGAFYHITSRGNEKQQIFFSEKDYQKFKSYILRAMEKYEIVIHCYVFMTNHYHLLIETPKANLSKTMHFINSSYSNYINRIRDRCGHLFQGRYKSIVIEKGDYLLELSKYMHLNPVRAEIVKEPCDYPYSSYNIYISPEIDEIVFCGVVLGEIANNISAAKRRYKSFVEDTIGCEIENPLEKVTGGIILGSERFIKETLKKTKKEIYEDPEISNRKRLKIDLGSEEIIDRICEYFRITKIDLHKNKKKKYRKIAIFLLKRFTHLSNKEIGMLFGNISYSAVAKANQRFKVELKRDRKIQNQIKELVSKMSNVKV